MEKGMKIRIAVVVIIFSAVIVGLGVIIYYYIFATSPIARKKMIAYYENDDNYQTVECSELVLPQGASDELIIIHAEPVDGGMSESETCEFAFPNAAYALMQDAGFVGDAAYRIVYAPAIWWDGGYPFAIGVYSRDGETVYLDSVAGKELLLVYIREILK